MLWYELASDSITRHTSGTVRLTPVTANVIGTILTAR